MAINWDAPIEIRDFRNGDWFWVNKVVWKDKRLTSSDKILYGTIAFFANQRQMAWPSIIQLANFSRVSKRQTYLSIKKLEKLRYIIVKRHRKRGKANEYCLLKIKGATITPIVKGAKSTLLRVQKQHPQGCKLDTTNKNNITIKKEFTPSASGLNLLKDKMETLGLKTTFNPVPKPEFKGKKK